MDNQSIILLSSSDRFFPNGLKNLSNGPRQLFAMGNLQDQDQIHVSALGQQHCVAVVGSRNADHEACGIARKISATLVQGGACVVSGLAYGIDAVAHRTAVEWVPASTIAVLGHGLGHLYPAGHRVLAQQIVQNGGVLVSQYEETIAPRPHQFLERNRIIAGMSLGVVVIQAHATSGSLATARFALEEGREVLVVPGRFGDDRFSGSNRLLREGAHPLCGLEDLFEIFTFLQKPEKREEIAMDPKLKELLAVIQVGEELCLDEFAAKINMPPNKVASVVSEFDLLGKLVRLPGNRVFRVE